MLTFPEADPKTKNDLQVVHVRDDHRKARKRSVVAG